MMRFALRATPEVVVLAALLALSLLGLAFMDALVAAPKLLFGRSLSALAPSLFPTIILSLLAVLCAVLLAVLGLEGGRGTGGGLSRREWLRGVCFFGIMILYALTMRPFGFLISSAVAVSLLSWQMGNRSEAQTVLLSLVAPALLYLAATRLLAVSLPELNAIELAYARMLGE
jgi:putative tricarboxylic transport membrane protein